MIKLSINQKEQEHEQIWFKVEVPVIDSGDPEARQSQYLRSVSNDTQNIYN